MQRIEYYQRSNFGNAPRIYIEDTQTAADLERLTGRRTHTLQDLQILTSIGAQFVEVADPRNNPAAVRPVKSRFVSLINQEGASR